MTPIVSRSRVRDNQQSRSPRESALKALAQVFRVERRKALIKYDKIDLLEQRQRHVQPASLAVRKLPACFAHHLQQPRRHSLKQIAEPKLAAYAFGLFKIFLR